jgi:hypothetical protein
VTQNGYNTGKPKTSKYFALKVVASSTAFNACIFQGVGKLFTLLAACLPDRVRLVNILLILRKNNVNDYYSGCSGYIDPTYNAAVSGG